MRKFKTVFYLCLLLLISTQISAQKKTIYPIAFYNLENLYDTENDKKIDDEEFLPNSEKKWNNDKYQKKLTNMAYAISLLGKEHNPEGIAILGVAEVENSKVLDDLIKTKPIDKVGYKYVHYDSPDKRGIDVALLYNPKYFKVKSSKKYPFKQVDNTLYDTRDQLLVSGIMASEELHIIVNHWPSRRGDNADVLRERAALICKQISDSIYKANPKAKIVIMGDMNDDPQDKSCRVVINAKKGVNEVKPGGLYNPMWSILEKGTGTLCYKDQWNLFDQIIISHSLLGNGSSLKFWKAEVFNKDFLIQQEGKFKGYPLRTFSGNTFLNGYSDHFPTLIYLTK